MRLKINDLGLSILAEVGGLEDLHFGWFEPDEPATLDALRVAQKRYTHKLLDQIPLTRGRVLDVGCGTGIITEELRRRGFDAEGLGPNPDLIARARARLGPGAVLHETTLENFSGTGPYDVILMAESVQYLNRVRGLAKAAALLRPGGHLVLADVFRVRALDQPWLTRAGHRHENFLRTAAGAGFRVDCDQDITFQVLPTLTLYHEVLSRRVVPALDLVAREFQRSAPFITRLVRLVTGSKLRLLRERYLHQDPETFQRYRTYRLMRLTRG